MYLRVRLGEDLVRQKNRLRAELAKLGVEIDNPFSKPEFERLRGLSPTIDVLIPLIEGLKRQIRQLESEIARLALQNEQAVLLTTILGMGHYAALTIVSVIGGIGRFLNSKRLCSYTGLVPSAHQSGNRQRCGSITKQGGPILRWILIQCAWMLFDMGIQPPRV